MFYKCLKLLLATEIHERVSINSVQKNMKTIFKWFAIYFFQNVMASAIGRQLVQGRSKAFLNVFLKIENLSGSRFLSTSGGPVCQGSDNQQRVPLTKRSLMAKRTAHDNPFDTYTLRPDATEGESRMITIANLTVTEIKSKINL